MLFPFSSLLEKGGAYLVLQSIQPSTNRFRLYIIRCREEQGTYVIDLSRGRFAQALHCKQEIFEEKDQLLSFLKSNIAARKRHGYRLVEMSLDFPLLKITYEMKGN